MTNERWQQIEDIFHAALMLSTEKRPAFLAANCEADFGLQAEVESFLATFAALGSRYEHPAKLETSIPTPLPVSLVGQQLGVYRVLAPLSAGGMGEVYRAQDARLGREAALKLLPAKFTTDAGRVRRFEQEARAASALNHPNIVTVYEIGETEAGRYIAMELVRGQTLRPLVGQQLSMLQLAALGRQIAEALTVAHAAGITHRDIKPENVMLRNDGYIKVLDFGLARLDPHPEPYQEMSAATPAQNTSPGMLMGTVAYMSPEQTHGKALTHATDIFSLGVVLYELATGQHPFHAPTLLATLQAIVEVNPSAPSRLNPEVPPALDILILQMLTKEASLRPSAQAVALALMTSTGSGERHSGGLHLAGVAGGGLASSLGMQTQAVERIYPVVAAPPALPQSPSIAVLPFVNLSADAENEYFCDGLAEELLNALAKIEGLKVAARTSAFSFKGKNVRISEIGQALKVGTVLEGSVRKVGSRLRITVQLINAMDGYQLWSERFDRQLADIFDIQDEITLAVVEALKVKLLGGEKSLMMKRYTDNTEAYELYLKGRYHFNKFTAAGWLTAIEYFKKALAEEPEYAPAYAGTALALTFCWFYDILPAQEAVPAWREAVGQALRLDPRLPDAHLARGQFCFYHEWQWEEAEREYQQAIALSPNSADAHQYYGLFLVTRERFEQGIREGRRALELDPLSLFTSMQAGWIYWLANRMEEALAQTQRMIEIEPNFVSAYWQRGGVYFSMGMPDEAVEALKKSLELGVNPLALSTLGAIYGMLGQRAEAEAIIQQLLALREQYHIAAFNLARVYSGMDEDELAYEWLLRACEERNGEMVFLHRETKIGTEQMFGKNFPKTQRFQALMRHHSFAP